MTYPQGPNPFDSVGFRISNDAQLLTYIEWNGVMWRDYTELPSKPGFYNKDFKGQSFQLSRWTPCYDWITDKGYDNFSTWVTRAK